MARFDPLQFAAAAYAAEHWHESEWRQFGRETGTSDILSSHPRLYRSLDFGDPDYPDAAADVLSRVLNEGVEEGTGEQGRMELLADSMTDLPTWVAEHAPARTKRLFREYIDARDSSEIPFYWLPTDPWTPESSGRLAAYAADELTVNQDNPVEGVAELGTSDAPTSSVTPAAGRRPIFIVHGHDEAALNSIRVFVHRATGVMPVSLAEEAGKGATIIEKFEKFEKFEETSSDASYVIVLLTPDDVGQTTNEYKAAVEPSPRARQNVVLELGYFIGKIGRPNIVAVVDATVEKPSDLAGLSYVQYPESNWKDALRTELEAAGLTRAKSD